MKNFWEKNKIFFALIIGSLIISVGIYFSLEIKDSKKDSQNLVAQINLNCEQTPDLPDKALKLVTKVIDGDTFLIEGGYSVRILGVDADERDHPCYDAAKNRLEELILNKKVRLEKDKVDKDQWCRYLRYVFVDKENIALKLVQEGLAVARFSPEDTKYFSLLSEAEKEAREKQIGCKWANDSLLEKTNFTWKKLTPALTGLKLVLACEAQKYLGQEVLVEGKVRSTYRSPTNTVFLNFEKPYPRQCFTGVIFSSALNKFPFNPERVYLNKTLRVRGTITIYQGKPEIILTLPEQIEIGEE